MISLLYQGAEKTLADWGISSPRLLLRDQMTDELGFDVEVEKFDQAPDFAVDEHVTFYNQPDEADAATRYILFQGIITSNPLSQSSTSEAHHYVVSGPWYWFERIGYQEKVYGPVDPTDVTSALVIGYQSEVSLGQGINGTRIDTAQQIVVALQYLLDTSVLGSVAGYPFATAPFQIPSAELTRDAQKLALDVQLAADQLAVNAAEIATKTWTAATRATFAAQRTALSVAWAAAKKSLQSLSGYYPSTNAPVRDEQDLLVSEVVRRELRYARDSICWFDYKTTPPTFHVTRQADATAVLLECGDDTEAGLKLSEVDLTARYDQLVSKVILKYQQVNQDNGANWRWRAWDVAPSGSPVPVGGFGPAAQAGINDRFFNALVSTIPLNGFSRTSTRGYVETEAIRYSGSTPNNAAAREWILKKIPALRDANVNEGKITFFARNVVLQDGTVIGGNWLGNTLASTPQSSWPVLTHELIGGQIASWMGITSMKYTINYVVTYETYILDGNGQLTTIQQNEKPFSVRLNACNAASGWFSRLQSYQGADTIPIGLAQELLDVYSVLRYDGGMTLHRSEINDDVGMGNSVNLSGGAAAWATMKSPIRSVDMDLNTGAKKIAVGFNPWLEAGNLVELYMAGRTRVSYNAPSAVASGQAEDSLPPIPDTAPFHDVTLLEGRGQAQIVMDVGDGTQADGTLFPMRKIVKIDGPAGQISMKQISQLTADDALAGSEIDLKLPDCSGHLIKVRQFSYKDGSGVTRSRFIPASDIV